MVHFFRQKLCERITSGGFAKTLGLNVYTILTAIVAHKYTIEATVISFILRDGMCDGLKASSYLDL